MLVGFFSVWIFFNCINCSTTSCKCHSFVKNSPIPAWPSSNFACPCETVLLESSVFPLSANKILRIGVSGWWTMLPSRPSNLSFGRVDSSPRSIPSVFDVSPHQQLLTHHLGFQLVSLPHEWHYLETKRRVSSRTTSTARLDFSDFSKHAKVGSHEKPHLWFWLSSFLDPISCSQILHLHSQQICKEITYHQALTDVP